MATIIKGTNTVWRPDLHPRDRRGRFRDVFRAILRLDIGEHADLAKVIKDAPNIDYARAFRTREGWELRANTRSGVMGMRVRPRDVHRDPGHFEDVLMAMNVDRPFPNHPNRCPHCDAPSSGGYLPGHEPLQRAVGSRWRDRGDDQRTPEQKEMEARADEMAKAYSGWDDEFYPPKEPTRKKLDFWTEEPSTPPVEKRQTSSVEPQLFESFEDVRIGDAVEKWYIPESGEGPAGTRGQLTQLWNGHVVDKGTRDSQYGPLSYVTVERIENGKKIREDTAWNELARARPTATVRKKATLPKDDDEWLRERHKRSEERQRERTKPRPYEFKEDISIGDQVEIWDNGVATGPYAHAPAPVWYGVVASAGPSHLPVDKGKFRFSVMDGSGKIHYGEDLDWKRLRVHPDTAGDGMTREEVKAQTHKFNYGDRALLPDGTEVRIKNSPAAGFDMYFTDEPGRGPRGMWHARHLTPIDQGVSRGVGGETPDETRIEPHPRFQQAEPLAHTSEAAAVLREMTEMKPFDKPINIERYVDLNDLPNIRGATVQRNGGYYTLAGYTRDGKLFQVHRPATIDQGWLDRQLHWFGRGEAPARRPAPNRNKPDELNQYTFNQTVDIGEVLGSELGLNPGHNMWDGTVQVVDGDYPGFAGNYAMVAFPEGKTRAQLLIRRDFAANPLRNLWAITHEILHGYSMQNLEDPDVRAWHYDNTAWEEAVVEGAAAHFRPRVAERMGYDLTPELHAEMDELHVGTPYRPWVEALDELRELGGFAPDEWWGQLMRTNGPDRARMLHGLGYTIQDKQTQERYLQMFRDVDDWFTGRREDRPEVPAVPQPVVSKPVRSSRHLKNLVRWHEFDGVSPDDRERIRSYLPEGWASEDLFDMYDSEEMNRRGIRTEVRVVFGDPDDSHEPLNGFDLIAEFYDNDDQFVGESIRTFDFGQKRMSHVSMDIVAQHRGTGITQDLLRSHVAMYDRLGMEKVSVYAAGGPGSNGGYTWARYGFDFQDDVGRNKIRSLLESSFESWKYELAVELAEHVAPENVEALATDLFVHLDGVFEDVSLADHSWAMAATRIPVPDEFLPFIGDIEPIWSSKPEMARHSWSGTLDLSPDSPSRQQFESYTASRASLTRAVGGNIPDRPINFKNEMAKLMEVNGASPRPIRGGHKYAVLQIARGVANFLKSRGRDPGAWSGEIDFEKVDPDYPVHGYFDPFNQKIVAVANVEPAAPEEIQRWLYLHTLVHEMHHAVSAKTWELGEPDWKSMLPSDDNRIDLNDESTLPKTYDEFVETMMDMAKDDYDEANYYFNTDPNASIEGMLAKWPHMERYRTVFGDIDPTIPWWFTKEGQTYKRAPGWEEGLVEGLARMQVPRIINENGLGNQIQIHQGFLNQHPYDPFVRLWRAAARILERDDEDFFYEMLDINPFDRIARMREIYDELPDGLKKDRYVQLMVYMAKVFDGRTVFQQSVVDGILDYDVPF